MSIEGYGVWDSFDIEYYGAHIAVKSTKDIGQLLLLETKDWDKNGNYLPNKDNECSHYDCFVLCRIKPDVVTMMKKQKMLFCDWIEYEEIASLILKMKFEYDIAGYITDKDLKRIIEKEYILPQNAIIKNPNRADAKETPMDAENYYVQVGNMRNGREFANLLNYYRNKKENNLQ